MKQKLVYLGWLIYRDIVHAGLDDSIPKEQRKKIIRLNQFVVLALLVNFLSVLTYFYHGLYISALINITSAYFFLLAYYFNGKRRLEAAKIISVVNLNVYLILISHIQGLRAGEYLLFFPYFLVLTFVVSIRKDFRELLFVYSITILSAVTSLKINPRVNNIQIISDELFNNLYQGNLAIAMFMTLIFSYAILRVNKDNEVAILQEKKFGDTIFNTSLDAVFILYSKSNIIASCNHRVLELFEVQQQREIEGTHIEKWFNEGNVKLLSNVEKSISVDNSTWQGETAFSSKTGKTFFGFVSIVPFSYKNTRYTKISILDISNVKMAEFELMKAKEKAESAVLAKSRFLSNMSHELRTPLNGIIGASNLLFQEKFLPDQKPHLDILRFSSEHMMMLINDILDYNKMEAQKMVLEASPVNMKELLNRIITQFRPQVEGKNLSFMTQVDPGLDMEFITDETRLIQVLSNLLSNAIKFTETGRITLSARRLFCSSQKATIRFNVEDTGIGIAAGKQSEIFGSFIQADVNTTRKYGGTGLGLAISKNLLNMFNSELVLKSDLGKGSQFHFILELKMHESRKSYINDEAGKKLASLDGVRILIAEDNHVNLSIAKRFLLKWGIQVSEAVNGREAVEKFSSHVCDLMLIDLEMPEMDGATALKEIRKINQKIPAIAFTAAVYENMQADLLAKGFADYIHKPFRPEDLHAKISSFVINKN